MKGMVITEELLNTTLAERPVDWGGELRSPAFILLHGFCLTRTTSSWYPFDHNQESILVSALGGSVNRMSAGGKHRKPPSAGRPENDGLADRGGLIASFKPQAETVNLDLHTAKGC
jgi:hypothetical protein